MQLIRTTHFKRDYKKLPPSIQKRTDEKLKLLVQKVSHPSLRVKKVQKYKGVFEGSVTRDYRFLFQITTEGYILLDLFRLCISIRGVQALLLSKGDHNIRHPSIPLPSIFSKIADLLKNRYDGKPTKELPPDLPAGTVNYGEKYVQSNPIQLPGHNATRFISGRLTSWLRMEPTGS